MRNGFRLGLMAGALLITAAGATAQNSQADRNAPPVWSAMYNVSQGALPDTAGWKVMWKDKKVLVRLAPGSDWSQYRTIVPGEVRYTGSEIKLQPRQIAEATDVLQARMGRDLRKVKLSPAAGAVGTVRVDANITDAMANPLTNMPEMTVSLVPAHKGRADVTAWVFDAATKQPVAEIEMTAGDEGYQWLWGFRHTGRLRAALRAQSKTLAITLGQMSSYVAADKKKAK